MLRALLLLPLCFLCTFAIGQTNSEKRSLSPFLVFDSYYSFIGNKSADVWGFKGGVKIDEKWRLGVGYNLLSSDIVEQKVLPSEELAYAKNDTVKAQLFFRYFPVMAEYIHYNEGNWQISTPLQVGYGQSYFQYFDKNNNKRRIFKKGVVASQLGVNAQYRVLKWFGLTEGVEYRWMLVNNKKFDGKMNSPFFVFGIKIFLSEFVKRLKEEN